MRRPTWAKWLFITIASVVGLFLLLTLSLNFWIEPIVEQAARVGLAQLSESGYRVDFQKLDLKPLRRQITLYDVTVSADSAQQSRLLAQGSYFTGQLDKLELQLDKYPYWESDKYLSISHLEIQHPYIQIHQSALAAEPEEDSSPLVTNTFTLIKPYLDSLRIMDINLQDGQITRILHDSSQVDTLKLPTVRLAIEDIRLDSLRALANNGLPTIKTWEMDAGVFRKVSKDSLYTYSIGSTHADLIKGSLAFTDMQVHPNYEKKEFASHLSEQKDRMEVSVHSLELDGLQILRLLHGKPLLARTMAVDSITLSIFKDKRFPRNTAHKPLLQTMLHSIPVMFQIDTILLTSGQIVYEEQNGISEEAGQVVFDQLYATLYGATNNPEATNMFQVDTRANLMSDGLLEVSFQIPLGSSDGTHYISGRLDRMHLERLNQLLEPVAFASVRSGVANLLDFKMKLNDQQATGDLRFIYNDLKVDILNQDDPDNPALKALLGTWLANWFVVKADNPTRSQPLRVGNIYFEHDATRSVFSYWCHALLSGIKESIGMPVPENPTASIENPSEEPEKPGLLKRIFGQNEN